MVVQNCHFAFDDGLREERGFEIMNENYGAIVRSCTMSGFAQAMHIIGFNDMLIEGCTITDNITGVNLCCLGSPSNNPNPDLGGGARGSAGGNTITGHTEYGLVNSTTNVIYAKYNTWDHNPPLENADYRNEGTGNIMVE